MAVVGLALVPDNIRETDLSVKKILILGANGMLGSMLVKYFASMPGCIVIATTRSGQPPADLAQAAVEWHALDACKASSAELSRLFSTCDYVINAIGLIRQRIRTDELADWETALRVNALFSVLLGQAAAASKVKVLQITTDCVYSGEKGKYSEADHHDALDVYGRSKSLGEVNSAWVIHLRCSIVGFELASSYSLLNWFLSRPSSVEVPGYVNHYWNGITSLHFAKLCHGIVEKALVLPAHQHVIPGSSVSKYELLCEFRDAFERNDLEIIPTEASDLVDRTLTTASPEINTQLWQAAGYQSPPTIHQMIMELAAYAKQS